MGRDKNLRTIKITINSQTHYHLKMLAAMAGWGEKDLGRVVDKIMKAYCQNRNGGDTYNTETKTYPAAARERGTAAE